MKLVWLWLQLTTLLTWLWYGGMHVAAARLPLLVLMKIYTLWWSNPRSKALPFWNPSLGFFCAGNIVVPMRRCFADWSGYTFGFLLFFHGIFHALSFNLLPSLQEKMFDCPYHFCLTFTPALFSIDLEAFWRVNKRNYDCTKVNQKGKGILLGLNLLGLYFLISGPKIT